MKLHKNIGVVGSREFTQWPMLRERIDHYIEEDDEIVSGGARGADSMAQRYCKEFGHDMQIKYPKYARNGPGATFIRNKVIVENSDLVLAFYSRGSFQKGGTANSAKWARELGVELLEFEEE